MYNPPTLDEQVERSKETQLCHRSLTQKLAISDKKSLTNIILPFNSFYAVFKDFLDKYTIVVPLSEAEQKRYRFSPKKMSLDFYHTVEYWDLILYINECPSILDFEPEYVRLVLNDKIKELITEIVLLSDQYMNG